MFLCLPFFILLAVFSFLNQDDHRKFPLSPCLLLADYLAIFTLATVSLLLLSPPFRTPNVCARQVGIQSGMFGSFLPHSTHDTRHSEEFSISVVLQACCLMSRFQQHAATIQRGFPNPLPPPRFYVMLLHLKPNLFVLDSLSFLHVPHLVFFSWISIGCSLSTVFLSKLNNTDAVHWSSENNASFALSCSPSSAVMDHADNLFAIPDQ